MPLLLGVSRKNSTRKRVSNAAQYYDASRKPPICICDQEIISGDTSTSLNDMTQTRNQRIAQLIRNNLGGTTQFGDSSNRVYFLGRYEGQPGGIGTAPKNKF